MAAPDRPPLRTHQRLALEAIERARSEGVERAWVVLPPGAGKTRVGLERALAAAAEEPQRPTVVLCPNTAIQGQWLIAARDVGLLASSDRTLTTVFTALTYQSLAVFDAEAETESGEPESAEAGEASLIAGLHPNGRELIDRLADLGPVLLVLDECHHLLEMWGRLLDEILQRLPHARVLGLTATPPDTLTAEQAALVGRLFGEVAYETSIPAVVREGHLAPFAELTWITEPTSSEQDWLAAESERFAELTTRLTDPSFGNPGFLTWLDQRFVHAGESVSWTELCRREPLLTDAALRMHHVGLLAAPEGARLNEQHRHDPTAADWIALIDDWVTGTIADSEDPADLEVRDVLRATLPAVGFQWTRNGIRRGRSGVDRVLARSASKQAAAVTIAGHEAANLGTRARVVALCDHEFATATLPVDLRGVIDAQTGSALALLEALLDAPESARLDPLLVTGRTIAASPETCAALKEFVAGTDPALAETFLIEQDPDAATSAARLKGGWTSRRWVRFVTDFFESGGTRMLVGTRGLLGEGWNARSISALIDLTASTTITSVVQTRGRALRTDPAWPEKVALNWTPVCVADGHPNGDNDWSRLVRKHAGFFCADADGDIIDGVAHLDAALSPYAPPSVDTFDAVNTRMLLRAEQRPAIVDGWSVGEPYDDDIGHSVRIIVPRHATGGVAAESTNPAAPVLAVARAVGPEIRDASAVEALGPNRRVAVSVTDVGWSVVALLAFVIFGFTPGAPGEVIYPSLLVSVLAIARVRVGRQDRRNVARGEALLRELSRAPTIHQVACAVADALAACELVSVGSAGVDVHVDSEGEYRCLLEGVSEEESIVFATALDEAVGPILAPRYVIRRHTIDQIADLPRPERRARAQAARAGTLPADGEVWHPVPTVLGLRATRAKAYAKAFDTWMGCDPPLYTGSPEGAGVLAAQRGSDPFAVTTVMRRQWG